MEVSWLCQCGLIACGTVWCGLAILCIAALVFDCWNEPERKLTTPLPGSNLIDPMEATDREPSRSAGTTGEMKRLAIDAMVRR